MQADPRVERQAVVARPVHVPLERRQRVALLPRRPHRGDQLREPGRGRDARIPSMIGALSPSPCRLGSTIASRAESTSGSYLGPGPKRRSSIVVHPAGQPVARRSGDRVAPSDDGVALLVVEDELKLRQLCAQPVPVDGRDVAVVDELREDVADLVRPVGEVGTLRVGEDLHRTIQLDGYLACRREPPRDSAVRRPRPPRGRRPPDPRRRPSRRQRQEPAAVAVPRGRVGERSASSSPKRSTSRATSAGRSSSSRSSAKRASTPAARCRTCCSSPGTRASARVRTGSPTRRARGTRSALGEDERARDRAHVRLSGARARPARGARRRSGATGRTASRSTSSSSGR